MRLQISFFIRLDSPSTGNLLEAVSYVDTITIHDLLYIYGRKVPINVARFQRFNRSATEDITES
jgi:hypothetical protein